MPQDEPGNQSSGPPRWQPPPLPWWRYLAWIIAILLFSWFWLTPHETELPTLSYSEFKTAVREDRVAWVEFQDDRVKGGFTDSLVSGDPGAERVFTHFVSTLPPVQDSDLIPLLEAHEVEIRAVSTEAHWLAKALIGVLPWVLIIGLFWYATTRMQQRIGGMGLFDFGKSRAKRFRHSGDNARNRRLSQGPRALPKTGRRDSARDPADGAAGYRQDPARASRRGRGRSAVFQHQRLGIHRNVRRRRRLAGTRHVRSRAQGGAIDYFH